MDSRSLPPALSPSPQAFAPALAPELHQALLLRLPQALEKTLWRWATTPTASLLPAALEPLNPAPHDQASLRRQPQSSLLRLMRLELRQILAALEVFLLNDTAAEAALARLPTHYARLSQLYEDLKHRAQSAALHLFDWELRRLDDHAGCAVAPSRSEQ